MQKYMLSCLNQEMLLHWQASARWYAYLRDFMNVSGSTSPVPCSFYCQYVLYEGIGTCGPYLRLHPRTARSSSMDTPLSRRDGLVRIFLSKSVEYTFSAKLNHVKNVVQTSSPSRVKRMGWCLSTRTAQEVLQLRRWPSLVPTSITPHQDRMLSRSGHVLKYRYTQYALEATR